ncbi:heat shock cognate 70 kDa protein [Spatholobus suberectus]|nr:heat shock cognate 70 kDa protein [Spatholobus suberectus]
MVLRGSEEQRGAKYMAASPKRSNPLHNFSLPFLKWGTQRKMRCATASAFAAGSDRRSSAPNSDESTATWHKALEPASGEKLRLVGNGGGGDEDGIAVVRQKLILDLKTEADRMKDAILRNEEEAVRPWNLRKRRAKVEAPVHAGDGRKVSKTDDKKRNHSSPARHDGASKLPQLRSGSDRTERVKFSLQLSKKEIEEDFMAMLGQRPPRRPNKRPKVVQKQLDTLFPGLWLTEVTADSYKVIEAAENGKVRHNGKRKVDVGV